jgi:predicted PurR-regulated permease PerM
MKSKIEIDTRTFVRFWLVLLGFAAGILVIYKTLSALIIIAVAFFLAIALNPPVSKIAKKLPGKSRVGATAIAYVLVIGVIGTLILTVVPPVIEQTSRFVTTVPSLIDQVNTKRTVVTELVHRYDLDQQYSQALDKIKQQSVDLASNLGNLLVGSVTSLIMMLATVLFVLVLTFLMLIEGPGWLDKIWSLYSNPKLLSRHKSLTRRMYKVVTGYVNGQMAVAMIASLCTLATVLVLAYLFNMPTNLAFASAAIIFVADLVPLVGATIGAILVSLILLLNNTGSAISFAIYFIIYQQFENNLISPMIQAKAVEISTLSVLISIVIGFALFGVFGGIISIPIGGCIRVLILDHAEHKRNGL